MNNEPNQSFPILLQSIHDWLASFGGIASVLLGVLLSTFILMAILFYRWIQRGGLKVSSTTHFFQRQQFSEHFCRNFTDQP